MEGQRRSRAARSSSGVGGGPRDRLWAVLPVVLCLTVPAPLAAQLADDGPPVPVVVQDADDAPPAPVAVREVDDGSPVPAAVREADDGRQDPVAVQEAGAGLQAQLGALAESEGFSLYGLAHTADEPARPTGGGDLDTRLQALLDGYNYFALYAPDGRISVLHILGVQPPTPPPPNRFFVHTTRRGQQHWVDATLTGPSGVWLQRKMILDTGASTIVLPRSLINVLGFNEADLDDGWAETAGGRVAAKSGQLAAVAVGKAEARGIAVIFIGDQHIGDKALLGMSFLQRFELTIDDFAQQVILTAK